MASTIVQELREEVEQALASTDGKWNKHTIVKLVKCDSAVRESLRISTFMSVGIARKVSHPNGVTINDGVHLPYGTRVGVAARSIHYDDNIYENAKLYDAFRFSRGFKGTKREGLSDTSESKGLAIVNTSEIFLYAILLSVYHSSSPSPCICPDTDIFKLIRTRSTCLPWTFLRSR
jgi:Cytochrome P450